MGRKGRGGSAKAKLPSICYYCTREFQDETTLVAHQQARHFRCVECNRKLRTLSAMRHHLDGVHKVQLKRVPNAKEGHDDPNINCVGMDGAPSWFMHQLMAEHGDPAVKEALAAVAGAGAAAAAAAAAAGAPAGMSVVDPVAAAMAPGAGAAGGPPGALAAGVTAAAPDVAAGAAAPGGVPAGPPGMHGGPPGQVPSAGWGAPYGVQHTPYGAPQQPYGHPPYGQAPYGAPYGAPPHGHAPYGAAPYRPPYGVPAFGAPGYGAPAYGAPPPHMAPAGPYHQPYPQPPRMQHMHPHPSPAVPASAAPAALSVPGHATPAAAATTSVPLTPGRSLGMPSVPSVSNGYGSALAPPPSGLGGLQSPLPVMPAAPRAAGSATPAAAGPGAGSVAAAVNTVEVATAAAVAGPSGLRLVFTDEVMSPEEKRAMLPRYAQANLVMAA